MDPINLVPLAQALASRPSPFHPQWLSGKSWMPNYEANVVEAMYSGMFLDDATSAQLAKLLGATVLQMIPRLCWLSGQPNTSQGTNVSTANFLGWETASSPLSYSVVQACDIGYYIGKGMCVGNLTWQQTMEMMLSFLIPGSQLSADTQAALNQDMTAQIQFSTVVPTSQAIWKPPATA